MGNNVVKKTFLFQKFPNGFEFDFQHVIRNQVVNTFCSASKDFHIEYASIESLSGRSNYYHNCIPIGSVEFVLKYLKVFHDIDLMPRNIPAELFRPSFLNRRISDWCTEELFDFEDTKFIKSNSRFKDICGVYNSNEVNYNKHKFIDDVYLVSDVVDFKSEFRAFIHRGKIQDIKQYVGDGLFPYNEDHLMWLHMAVKTFTLSPISYTLDFGLINENNTNKLVPAIIEVHDMFSVGLYGFENEKLPYMFSQSFYERLKLEGKYISD